VAAALLTAAVPAAAQAVVSPTKTVSGGFYPGGSVTYTVVLANLSAHPQADNPGPEFTDVLPPQLTLVSATASAGFAVATFGTNTVTWNGSLGGGAAVTITIQATVGAGVPFGTTIANQGTVFFDADGDGTNESSALTDEPALPGAANPTTFTIPFFDPGPLIPTLDSVGIALFALLLAGLGAMMLRRRAKTH
jgi:uncharacterized repeat protein (TIGR01451 family)